MDRKIRHVVTLIERNPQQKLSLTNLAQAVHLSTSRLRHKFKSEVGITPTVYLQSVRMRKAAELLEQDQLSIKEVRAAIGFTSDSYFTHLCRRLYGHSPSCLKSQRAQGSD